MTKKSKKKGNGAKAESKEVGALVPDNLSSKNPGESESANRQGIEKPIVRAIRVTSELLAAAKEYKKARGVSFYTLGFESISERLAREGFLKKGNQ